MGLRSLYWLVNNAFSTYDGQGGEGGLTLMDIAKTWNLIRITFKNKLILLQARYVLTTFYRTKLSMV